MSSYRDKPWLRPIEYVDDRFTDPSPSSSSPDPGRQSEELDAADVEERINRPARDDDRAYECNDATPLNYGKGPHDEVLGVEDSEFDAPDDAPLDYESGPHDDEFGDDDEE